MKMRDLEGCLGGGLSFFGTKRLDVFLVGLAMEPGAERIDSDVVLGLRRAAIREGVRAGGRGVVAGGGDLRSAVVRGPL